MIAKYSTKQMLSQYLDQEQQVEVIVLEHCALSALSYVGCKSLLILVLDYCKLSNLSKIQQFQLLQQFSIKYNDVKDPAQLSKVNKRLKAIDVRGNPWTPAVDQKFVRQKFPLLTSYNQPIGKKKVLDPTVTKVNLKEVMTLSSSKTLNRRISKKVNQQSRIDFITQVDQENQEGTNSKNQKQIAEGSTQFNRLSLLSLSKMGRINDYIEEIDKDLAVLADTFRLGWLFRSWAAASKLTTKTSRFSYRKSIR